MDALLKAAKLLLVGSLLLLFAGLIHGSPRNVEFDALAAQVMESMDAEELKQGDEQLLRRLYGLNGGDFEHWLLYTAKDNMNVEELLLIECADGDQIEAARQAAEQRAKTQKNNFEGYGPAQVQLIENRVLWAREPYLLFVISEDAEAVKADFLKTLYR